MPILALPESTARLLGSSVVITEPCDVVKELIDNAIDAGASLIEVAVSPNHLDTIRVRDDGRGIDMGDFNALGRRAHTSKLTTFDKLGERARDMLGFRGEALAAMNTLANATITTRTEKDVVATRLQLKHAIGGVEREEPASAKVGTTVHITKLFETLPARKQYSLKKTAKYLQSTKDLLKAYALARPNLRISFKIIGEATYSWSYAPTRAAGFSEAVLQVFGKSLANSCIHVSWNSGCDQTEFSQFNQQASEDFILEAFMPKLGCDVQAVKGKGLYLSIDSRPVSSTRGIAKRITAMFKKYLCRAAGTDESWANVSNPFIQLNIRCPPYSYDANVSPLKDEVVFRDEEKIMVCFEGLCRKMYPEGSMDDPFVTKRSSKRTTAAGASTARKGRRESMQPNPVTERQPDSQNPKISSNKRLLSTMEQSDTAQEMPHRDQPTNQASHSRDGATLAKMRILKTVNMSRTNSNSTDEDGTSVDVQVPLSLMTFTQVPSGQRADASARIPNVSALENIERYLLSQKKETFQIATDETATRSSVPLSESHVRPSGASGRIPLQPLTESALNAMHDQIESESDTSSDESETSESPNNAESMLAAHRRDQRAGRASPDPVLPSIEAEPLGFHSPLEARSVAEWLTPPSSGPLRGVRPLNPPFRPPQMSSQRESPTVNATNARSRLRPSGSGRVIPFILPGQNLIQRPAGHERTAQQVASRIAPRSNAGETRLRLQVGRVRGANRQRNNSARDSVHASAPLSPPDVRNHVPQMNPTLREPGQHSPSMQTNLMRNPSPNVTSRTTQDGLNCETLSTDAAIQDSPPSSATSSEASDDMEDPRLYLISRARQGFARRLSQRRLPFEKTPEKFQMQKTSTSRRVSLKKVKTLVNYDTLPGDWGHATKFKTMEEVGNVEPRLRNAVQTWKQTQSQGMEVEYNLRCAAKGKKSMNC